METPTNDEAALSYSDPHENRELIFQARLAQLEERGETVHPADPRLYHPTPEEIPDWSRSAVHSRGCMIRWHCQDVHPEQYPSGCEAACLATWDREKKRPNCFGHRSGLGLALPDFLRAELGLTCLICPVGYECLKRSELTAQALLLREAEATLRGRVARAAPPAPRSRFWFGVGDASRRVAGWNRMVDAVAERVVRAVHELALQRYAARWKAELEEALAEGPIGALPLERLEARIPEVVARGVCPPFYPFAKPVLEPGAPAPPDPSWPRLRVEDLAQEIAERGAVSPSREPLRSSVDLGFFFAGNGGTTLVSEFRAAEALHRTPPRGADARGGEALVWRADEGAWLLPGERRASPGAAGAALAAPPDDWDVEANWLLAREVLAYEEDGRRPVERVLLCAPYRERLLEYAETLPGTTGAWAREALDAYPRWPSSAHVVLR